MKKVIYVIGSMRNPLVIDVAAQLRHVGFDVFDDWYAPGPEADDFWQSYAKHRGQTYKEALSDYHARHVFEFDKFHLDRAEVAVLVMPAGRSAHIELGYMVGQGKKAYVLFDTEPERYDIMYNFATGVCFSVPELLTTIKEDLYVN